MLTPSVVASAIGVAFAVTALEMISPSLSHGVVAGIATAIILGLVATFESLLSTADSESPQDPGEYEPITLMDLSVNREIIMPGGGHPEPPPEPTKSFTPEVLALLSQSYKYLGEPMGSGADGFQMWLDEFTTWGYQNNCWVAVLPPVLVVAPESKDPPRGLSA
jgi:hypothetical protein